MGEEVHVRSSIGVVAHQLEGLGQAGLLLERDVNVRLQGLHGLRQYRDDRIFLVMPDGDGHRARLPCRGRGIPGAPGQQHHADQQQTQYLAHSHSSCPFGRCQRKQGRSAALLPCGEHPVTRQASHTPRRRPRRRPPSHTDPCPRPRAGRWSARSRRFR